jgi:hypothetical protein
MNEERGLVTQEQELATALALYGGDREIAEFGHVIRKIAPWAEKMADTEIGLVVRRSLAMGLDPLNPHEVQIWKDNRGRVQFQLAYTLMAEWVRECKGEHTEPAFLPLSDGEKAEEGLDEGAMAFYVSFVMKDDLNTLRELIDLGYKPAEAKRMVTVNGLGVASADELKSQYFAPNARSAGWKVKKRALVDAYRRKFGTPTRPEIISLRRIGKIPTLTVSDWEEAADEETVEGRLQLASLSANTRKRLAEIEAMSDEEAAALLEKNREILHGTDEDEWDAPKPKPEREPDEPEDVRRSLRIAADWHDGKRPHDDEQEPPPEKLVQRVAALMTDALTDPNDDQKTIANKRHSVLAYLWKQKSTKALALRECEATAKWLEAQAMGYRSSAVAAQECRLMLREALKKAGQAELPGVED